VYATETQKKEYTSVVKNALKHGVTLQNMNFISQNMVALYHALGVMVLVKLKGYNKVVNNAHYRSLGQPTLRFGCPLPQR